MLYLQTTDKHSRINAMHGLVQGVVITHDAPLSKLVARHNPMWVVTYFHVEAGLCSLDGGLTWKRDTTWNKEQTHHDWRVKL